MALGDTLSDAVWALDEHLDRESYPAGLRKEIERVRDEMAALRERIDRLSMQAAYEYLGQEAEHLHSPDETLHGLGEIDGGGS